jgi:chaperonin cofactor prefoldin
MQTVIIFMMFIARLGMASVTDASVQEFTKEAKNRPVSKVIALLQDMVTQLEKEGEDDQEIYDTMGCWCVTNEKSKTKSIADAETSIETLTASIESLTATSAKLNTQIAKLEAEIKEKTEALEAATSVREKELAEFTQAEKDSLVSITQLKDAVIALSAAHDAALLKTNSKVGKVDSTKLSAADSGVDPKFAKEIEAEAIRAHMQRILYTHPYQFVASFMQVNHNSLEPAQRQKFISLLQGASKDVFDDLPEHLNKAFAEAASKPVDQFLQSSEAAPAHFASHGRFAEKIRDFARGLADDWEEKHGGYRGAPVQQHFKADEIPAPIQSLISKVLKGVKTGLLESSMDDSETGNTKYEPASGAIFGVLKQMKENFETNLAQSQQAEAKASDEFDQMKAASEDQIKASTDLMNAKAQELAQTDEKNAEDKEIKDDTEASLAADQAFLADLKERCASMDEQFAERTKGRQLEIQAVSKALAFLNSDEAHDLFTRSFNPTLLQVNMKSRSRLAGSNALKAKEVRQLRLAAKMKADLLKSAQLKAGDNPAFDKIKSSIGEMVDKLKKEQQDEMKFKDYCIEEIDQVERDIAHKERDRDELNALISDLKLTIETLDKEIEVLKAEIAELQVEMKRATENRNKEKAEFETTVADQRATQKLLAISLKILSDFYNAALIQTNQKGQKSVAGQAPPPGFKTYEKSASSGGVMGMMQGIIDDAKAMEAECVRAETKAVKDFEDFLADTAQSIETKTNDIETKSEDKAKAEADKVQAETDLQACLTELEALINEEADIHKKCDFLMKNFELSQEARNNEIEGLKQATNVFSGASFKDVH